MGSFPETLIDPILVPFSLPPHLPRELNTTSGTLIRGTKFSFLFLLSGDV